MSKENQKAFIENLWDKCINKDSWILPQILATLSIIDPNFSIRIKAKEFINAFLDNKSINQEIELLLNQENENNNIDEKYCYGLAWKNNLIELINKEKL